MLINLIIANFYVISSCRCYMIILSLFMIHNCSLRDSMKERILLKKEIISIILNAIELNVS